MASKGRRTGLLCSAAVVALVEAAWGQMPASWLNPVAGSWADGTKWSTNPVFPNSAGANALISVTGAPYVVTLNSDITVNSLTFTVGNARLRQSTGNFAANSVVFSAGTYELQGGRANVSNIDMSSGAATNANLIISGGTHTLNIVNVGGVSQTANMSILGGTGTLLNVDVFPFSSFAMSGGSWTALNGFTLNQSSFSLTGGTLTTRQLRNSGGESTISINSTGAATPVLRIAGDGLDGDVSGIDLGNDGGRGVLLVDSTGFASSGFLELRAMRLGDGGNGTFQVRGAQVSVGHSPIQLGGGGLVRLENAIGADAQPLTGNLTTPGFTGVDWEDRVQFVSGVLNVIKNGGEVFEVTRPTSVTQVGAGRQLAVINAPLALSGTANCTVDGGQLYTAGLAGATAQNFAFTSGLVHFNPVDGDPMLNVLAVGQGSPVPRLTLQSTQILESEPRLNLVEPGAITLSGGILNAATLSGVTGGLVWSSGTLALASEYDFNSNPIFGTHLNLGLGKFFDGATLTVGSGSTVSISGGGARIGQFSNVLLRVNGNLQISSGTLDVVGSSALVAGDGGDGTIAVSGGVTNIATDLVVGGQSSVLGGLNPGNATLLVSGGSVNVSNTLQIGNGTFDLGAGASTFSTGRAIQTAGYVGALNNGVVVGQNGTYAISAGTLEVGSGYLDVSGSMAQTGGLVLVDRLYTEDYAISAGTLDATRSNDLFDASPRFEAVIGPFQHTGGTVRGIRGSVRTGATYALSGGTMQFQELSVTEASTLSIQSGVASIGFGLNIDRESVFTMTGGNLTVGGDLSLLRNSQATLSGGEATVNALSMDGGQLNITGGTTAGTLRVGAGGLVLGGDSPVILLGADSQQSGRLIVNGPVRSVVQTGLANIVAFAGIGQQPAVLDLAGATREFSVDDGDSATDLRIALPVMNGGIRKTGTGQMALAANFSGSGGLQVDGGTLLIQNNQTFSGDVLLRGGVLSFSRDQHLGNPSNQVRFDGGTLKLTSNITSATFPRRFDVQSVGTLDLSGRSLLHSGTISGSGRLNVVGDVDTFYQLNANSSFSGELVIRGGQVRFNETTGGQMPNLGTLTLEQGGLITQQIGGVVIPATTAVNLRGGTLGFSGTFGALRVERGESRIGDLGGDGATFSGLAARSEGATLNIGSNQTFGGTALSFPPGLPSDLIGLWATFNDTQFVRYNAGTGRVELLPATTNLLSGTLPPVEHANASGLVNLGGVGTVTIRSLTVSSGTIETAGFPLVLSEGGLIATGSPSQEVFITGTGSLTSPTELLITNTGSLTITARIALTDGQNAVPMVKSGPGTLTLGGGPADTARNYYPNGGTAITYVNRGTLVLNKADGTDAIPGDLQINGGAVVLANNNQINDAATVVINAGTFDLNNKVETVFNLINRGGNFITGTGSLTVLSNNTMSLQGGITTVSSGGSINAAAMSVSGGNNVVQSNAIIQITGSNGVEFLNNQGANPTLTLTPDPLLPGTLRMPPAGTPGRIRFTPGTGSLAASAANLGGNFTAGDLDLNGGTTTFDIGDGAAAVDLLVTARVRNGSVVKSGGGTLRMTGPNTYAGGTRVTAGTLEVTNPATLGPGTLTLDGGNLRVVSDNLSTELPQPLAVRSFALDFSRQTAGPGGTLRIPLITVTAPSCSIGFGTAGAPAGNGAFVLNQSFIANADTTIDNSATVRIQNLVGGPGATLSKQGQGVLQLGDNSQGLVGVGVSTLTVNQGRVEGSLFGTVGNNLLVLNPGTQFVGRLANWDRVTVNSANGQASAEFLSREGGNGMNHLQFVAGGLVTGAGAINVLQQITTTGGAGVAQIDNAFDTGTIELQVPITTPQLLLRGELLSVANGNLFVTGGGQIMTVDLSGGGHKSGSIIARDATVRISGNDPLRVGGLATESDGRIDLISQGLIIDYPPNQPGQPSQSPLQSLRPLLVAGYNNGAWNGSGIASTIAAGNGFAVAYAEAATLAGLNSFAGEQLDSSSILIRLTLPGDADLSGTVTIDDFGTVAANFNTAVSLWTRGDFNYDGVVNIDDFGALAANFNESFAMPPTLSARPAAVPEPAMLTALLPAAVGNRRRRQMQA